MNGLINLPSGDLQGAKTSEFLTELLRAVEQLALSVRNAHGRERFPLETATDHINRCRYLLGEIAEMPPTHARDRWPEGTEQD